MSERLYRSRDDRMLAGVAGGLADRLGIDPSVVRIAWAILVLPTGFLAVLAYVVMAIVVPDQDDVERDASMSAPGWPAPQPTSGYPPYSTYSPYPPGTQVPGVPATSARQVDIGLYPAVPPASDPSRSARNTGRAARRERRQGSAAFLVGGSLIVLGTWFLLREYVPALDLSRFWPVAVVGLGILLVILALSKRSHDHDGDSG